MAFVLNDFNKILEEFETSQIQSQDFLPTEVMHKLEASLTSSLYSYSYLFGEIHKLYLSHYNLKKQTNEEKSSFNVVVLDFLEQLKKENKLHHIYNEEFNENLFQAIDDSSRAILICLYSFLFQIDPNFKCFKKHFSEQLNNSFLIYENEYSLLSVKEIFLFDFEQTLCLLTEISAELFSLNKQYNCYVLLNDKDKVSFIENNIEDFYQKIYNISSYLIIFRQIAYLTSLENCKQTKEINEKEVFNLYKNVYKQFN